MTGQEEIVMNFRQDEEHQDILEMVHDFAVNEVKPLAAEIDRTEEFPMKNVKMMAEMGLMGIPFPEEWAGLLGDQLVKVTGIPGAVFCHKGLFLSVWDSRESCEEALNLVLKLQGVE